MEELKVYRTLVKKSDMYGINPFILGRISGFMFAICNHYDENKYRCGYAMEEGDLGYVMSVNTTEKDYQEFLDVCENMYPGLVELYETYVL